MWSSVMSSSNWIFPNSLEGFGYAFNEDGQLRKLDPATGRTGNQPFEFNVSGDSNYNQKRYEALGEVVTEYVYGLLENQLGLQKLSVPKDGTASESTFVFASQDIYTNTERLLILIHGNGVVRAGQWARSLIINNSLESGTQIPAIKRAQDLGYAVLVLNINDNYRFIGGRSVKIQGSGNPEEHIDYVWQNYIKQTNPRNIVINAHSYGGYLTLNLATRYFSDFRNTVFAITMSDSTHNVKKQNVPSEVMNYLQKVACNWVTHDSPVGTPLQITQGEDVPKISAGSTKHEMTAWTSFEPIFKFIQERYCDAVANSGGSGNRGPCAVRVVVQQKVEYQYIKF